MPTSSANPSANVLILMRHAKRAGGLDLLAAEGHKQAEGLPKALEETLAKLAKREGLPNRIIWQIFASPKTRTQQTLRFLSEAVGTPSAILPGLDERTSEETQKIFENRVRHILDGWDDEAQTSVDSINARVACSHLDWLEAASLFLSSDESDHERSMPWTPLDTRVYILQNGIWNRFRR